MKTPDDINPDNVGTSATSNDVSSSPSKTDDHSAAGFCRRITNKLFECLRDKCFCKHRFSFGTKHFCSWLLRSEEDHSELNFPCRQENQQENQD